MGATEMKGNPYKINGGAEMNLSLGRVKNPGDPSYKIACGGKFSVDLWKVILVSAAASLLICAALAFTVKCIVDFFRYVGLRKRYGQQLVQERMKKARLMHIGRMIRRGRRDFARKERSADADGPLATEEDFEDLISG